VKLGAGIQVNADRESLSTADAKVWPFSDIDMDQDRKISPARITASHLHRKTAGAARFVKRAGSIVTDHHPDRLTLR